LRASCYWTFKSLHSCSVVCQNKSKKPIFWFQSKLCCVLARYNDTRDLRRPANYPVFNVPENKSKLSTFRSTLFSPNGVSSELYRVDGMDEFEVWCVPEERHIQQRILGTRTRYTIKLRSYRSTQFGCKHIASPSLTRVLFKC